MYRVVRCKKCGKLFVYWPSDNVYAVCPYCGFPNPVIVDYRYAVG